MPWTNTGPAAIAADLLFGAYAWRSFLPAHRKQCQCDIDGPIRTSSCLLGVDELLCLGHTHQPGYRAVLERLSALPFVADIHEAFFE